MFEVKVVPGIQDVPCTSFLGGGVSSKGSIPPSPCRTTRAACACSSSCALAGHSATSSREPGSAMPQSQRSRSMLAPRPIATRRLPGIVASPATGAAPALSTVPAVPRAVPTHRPFPRRSHHGQERLELEEKHGLVEGGVVYQCAEVYPNPAVHKSPMPPHCQPKLSPGA